MRTAQIIIFFNSTISFINQITLENTNKIFREKSLKYEKLWGNTINTNYSTNSINSYIMDRFKIFILNWIGAGSLYFLHKINYYFLVLFQLPFSSFRSECVCSKL
jgi:hypothetical protein